ncbi:LOW QUALITY PROTEIN: hypothetical protein U9M48_012428 [Paspalum notatum var. saurae]|uniref:F-box domain-containing protein n=1 Tax=Paspalum notatum var. saurae TaxID=547442 RepID=A0AAQ3SZF4_PASNO
MAAAAEGGRGGNGSGRRKEDEMGRRRNGPIRVSGGAPGGGWTGRRPPRCERCPPGNTGRALRRTAFRARVFEKVRAIAMGEDAAGSKRARRGQRDSPLGGSASGGPDLISHLRSPTTSSAASSRSSPPRTAPAPRSSRAGGVPSGAPPRRSTSRRQARFPKAQAAHPRLRRYRREHSPWRSVQMPSARELVAGWAHGLSSSPDQLPEPSLGVTVGETLRETSVLGGQVIWEGSLEELIVVDAPLLERLIPRVPAPRVRTLGYLHDDIPTFLLGTMHGSMHFKKMVPVRLPAANPLCEGFRPSHCSKFGFRYLLIEMLSMCGEAAHCVIHWMMVNKDVQCYAPLECLDRHLKMVQIINYEEKRSDINFTNFFVMNAGVLESMKFVVRRDKCGAKWIARQHKKLQVNERASQGARFYFEADCGRGPSSVVHMNHIHDLSLDPFDTSLCGCPVKGSKRAKRDQQDVPPGGRSGGGAGTGDDGDPDLISRLPDEVLGSIITLLPTKDGARTQILSRRWCRLWCSAAPLNLEAQVGGLDFHEEKQLVSTFRKILSAHEAPFRRLSLVINQPCNPSPHIVDSFLRNPGLDRFQEVELHLQTELPMALLRLFPAVSVLSIRWHRELPMETSFSNFPSLKQLTLADVDVSDSTVHDILSRCPVLESLLLDMITGCRRLRISSPTLRSLGVTDRCVQWEVRLEELIIVDAPLLERLIPRIPSYALVIRVIQAPRLRTLGYLHDDIPRFQIGTMHFKKMVPVSLPVAIRSVKILGLLTAPNLDFVTCLLKCFPCVEKLHIVSYTRMILNNDMQCYAPLECLDRHLKKVQIINYEEKRSDVNFIKFFVLNARVLESMKLVVRRDTCGAKWIARQHKKLRVNDRASQGARFDFEADCSRGPSSVVHMKHVHDLAMDPFDRSCGCPHLMHSSSMSATPSPPSPYCTRNASTIAESSSSIATAMSLRSAMRCA